MAPREFWSRGLSATRALALRGEGSPIPGYPAASLLSLAVLAAADVAVVPGSRPPVAMLCLGCFAVVLGALQGACWKWTFAALSRAPRLVHGLLWPLAGLCAGGGVAYQLGAFARLSGRYQTLAFEVLAACGAGGLGLGIVACWMQPNRTHRAGQLLGYRRRFRVALCSLLLAVAALLFAVDHTRFVGLYPAAHAALRWAGLWSLMFALVSLPEWLRMPRLGLWQVGLLCAAALAPLVLLGAQRPTDLHAMTLRPWSRELLRVSQKLLDFDGDGYAAWLGGGDCDNFNASVHPRALEIPDNGVDDNCVLGDGKRRSEQAEHIAAATEPAPTDIVVISIDALRPDHLGAYNPRYGAKGRNTSPNLDAWARDAAVFRNAFAPGAWTIISLSSMMRGLYARRLHWDPFYETSTWRLAPADKLQPLAPGETLLHFFPVPANDKHATMAELFKRRGMHTIAVVDDGFSAMLQPGNGLDRGFERYLYPPVPIEPPDPESVKRARRALRAIPGDQRYFLWMHLFGLHYPNDVHPEVPRYGPTMEDGYDHELRFVDLQLKDLFETFEARDPKPIVIITGDHGETIAPWMRSHGFGLDEPTMRVPLLIKGPGIKPGTFQEPVSLVDLLPTLLALTKTPGPAQVDGMNLAPLLTGEAGEPPAGSTPRYVLTDCWRFAPDRTPYLDAVGASDGRRVVFYDRATGLVTSPGFEDQPAYAVPAQAALGDPLARFALGYTEEFAGEPIH